MRLAGQVPAPDRRIECDQLSLAGDDPSARLEWRDDLTAAATATQVTRCPVFPRDMEHARRKRRGDEIDELGAEALNLVHGRLR